MKFHKVHISQPPREEDLEFLKARLDPRLKLTLGPDPNLPGDYQILVDGRPTAALLGGSPNLSVLIIPWAGLSMDARQRLREYPHIQVHNLHHNAAPTAEMALTLLFAVAKKLIPLDQALRANDWRPRFQWDHIVMLEGKRALILGYGSVGQHLGWQLSALGVSVSAIRRKPAPEGDDVAVYPPETLPDLLPSTEILIITLPLTDATEGMIGAPELALLPQGAIVVNVGRGPVVDQEALYNALKDGRLLGAGLDVWYNYPPDEESRNSTPPADFPFHELVNVVMSPHRGGGSAESERLRMAHLADLLNAAARGESIPNLVDLERGY